MSNHYPNGSPKRYEDRLIGVAPMVNACITVALDAELMPCVYDYGCGDAFLATLFTCDVDYTGLDDVLVDAQYSNIKVVDFNKGLPKLTKRVTRGARGKKRAVDLRIATCFGLLEYLDDLPGFLAWLAENHDVAIVTYCCNDTTSAEERRLKREVHGWTNHFSATEMAVLLVDSGFTMVQGGIWSSGSQRSYVAGPASTVTKYVNTMARMMEGE